MINNSIISSFGYTISTSHAMAVPHILIKTLFITVSTVILFLSLFFLNLLLFRLFLIVAKHLLLDCNNDGFFRCS